MKYAFFTSNDDNIKYADNIKSLLNNFYKILSNDALENYYEEMNKEFYYNIENDGYYIIDMVDNNIIYFYLDLERLNDIYNDLKDNRNIINIIKDKLNEKSNPE